MTEQPPTSRRSNTSGRPGERRVVTALFCDVAGSTAMAEQFDPEDWADLMNEAFELLIAPITRYEGTVIRLLGDAVLAFFGAPQAHEDDPQRAVLASLEMLEAIGPFREQLKRESGTDFNVRIGINTGPVVVGGVGALQSQEYTAMGDAVNIAARMEQTAEPGTVRVADATYRLAAPLFEWEDLGEIEVKGKSEPVAAFRAIARSAHAGSVRGIEGHRAPLIGRARELDVMGSAVSQLAAGRGQILVLTGEAGLGKSRLISELRGLCDEALPSHLWVESRAVAYDATRPYSLFHQAANSLVGIDPDDPFDVVHRKVEASLESFPEEQRTNVATAVNLMLTRADAQSGLQGESFKRELFEATRATWRFVAGCDPAILVFDDLHWADEASTELLEHLVGLVEEVPVLFVCATRPDRRSPGWRIRQYAESEFPHRSEERALSPLPQEYAGALVDALLAVADLPDELRGLILAKAEGNPFFVEEVVRTLIESGVIVAEGGGMRWHASGPVADIAIPDNLQSLLTARIDRLQEDVRGTLQAAAVIGRNFHRRVLEYVASAPDALDTHLGELQRVDLVREVARTPEVEYSFRHELTRQAAYDSILRRRRSGFHRGVAEAIELAFPDRVEDQAHLLAYHCAQAGDDERTLYFATIAADAAARVYANTEAEKLYADAIAAARRLDVAPERLIGLYTRRGRTLELAARQAEAADVYRELQKLGEERGSPTMRVAAMVARAPLHCTFTTLFDPTEGRALAEEAMELAHELGDAEAEARAAWNLQLVNFFDGLKAETAIEYGERAVSIARAHGLTEILAFALNDLVRPYAMAARPGDAGAALEEALVLFHQLDNKPMTADVLDNSASQALFQGRLDDADRFTREAAEIAESIGSVWLLAATAFERGYLLTARGDFPGAAKAYDDCIDLATKASFVGGREGSKVFGAWMYHVAGSDEHARTLAAQFEVPVGATNIFDVMASANGLVEAAVAIGGAGLGAAVDHALVQLAETDLPDFMQPIYGMIAESLSVLGRDEELLAFADRHLSRNHLTQNHLMSGDLMRLRGIALVGLGSEVEGLQSLRDAVPMAEQRGGNRAFLDALIALSANASGEEAAQARERAAALAQEIVAPFEEPFRSWFLAKPEIAVLLGA